MPLKDALASIAGRLPTIRDNLLTEESTKTALILPFIQALGYDVFNPIEVVPEFTADVGIKKGEKVDYAIFDRGQAVMLFECKPCGAKLNRYSSQLYRYFSVTAARIAVLTDGVEYRFFTDLVAPNRLDDRPFMVLDLSEPDEKIVDQVGLLCKGLFNLDSVLASAGAMKDLTDIRAAVLKEIESPSDALVRYFADPIHDGRMTQGVLDRFRPLVKAALDEAVSERVEHRLHVALDKNRSLPVIADSAESCDEPLRGEADVETTMEEIEAFYAVKAILRSKVDPGRIIGRDVQSYFGVLLDDNNRKPICRLWFNRRQKYLGVFDAEKAESRIPIESPQGVFDHADSLLESLSHVL